MSEAGLTFRETMRGPFTLNETEPERGASAGRESRTTLTLKLTIAIADVAEFARESSHTAKLYADVRFNSLPGVLSPGKGIVRLFAPADLGGADTRKVMYYGIRTMYAGRELFISGIKQVDGGSVFSMWPETTTLYTRLHDGPDDQSPVIGAGILRLGPLAFLLTLPSMRPTPARRGLAPLARFGSFFVGELWDSYVSRGSRAQRAGADAPPV